MAKHLSSAVEKRSNMVARLKKVIVAPKYEHKPQVSGLIPIRVKLREYETSTNGLSKQVPVKSVTTNDVMRMWNKLRCHVPPLLMFLRRRISKITRAATFPKMPIANMEALIRGFTGGLMWCLKWHVSLSTSILEQLLSPILLNQKEEKRSVRRSLDNNFFFTIISLIKMIGEKCLNKIQLN